MTSKEFKKYLYCAAIDFGTTYTGLVYAPWGTLEYAQCTWGEGAVQMKELKVPTTILFDSKRKFLAFGFDAIKKFSAIPSKNNCYYFESFKMILHHKEVRWKTNWYKISIIVYTCSYIQTLYVAKQLII